MAGRSNEVRLRDVQEDDIALFFRHQSDPVAVDIAQVPARDEAAYFERWRRLLTDPSVHKKTILCNDAVAGHVMTFHRDGVRELGYWLDRAYWGRGITSTAVRLFLSDEPERPLFAVVAERNVASRRILARCGFEPFRNDDGVLRFRLAESNSKAGTMGSLRAPFV